MAEEAVETEIELEDNVLSEPEEEGADALEADDTEPDEEETVEDGQAEDEGKDQDEGQQEEESDADVLTVSFDGDDDEPEQDNAAPEWARELRKEHRKLKKEKRDLEKKLAEKSEAQEQVALGPKPTLESAGYDEEKFEADLIAWQEQKRKVEAEKVAQEEINRKAEEEFQEKLSNYNEAKGKLSKKAKDFVDAEDEVQAILPPMRQGIMLDAVKDPALMVYVLGKNPQKLQKLASIKNDVQFIAELARLEQSVKVSKVKKAPAPEKRVGSSGGVPIGSQAQLEKLEKEADRTGDRTKVIAFKKRLRDRQSA